MPRLVGCDVDGAGGPVDLLTWRQGRVRLDPLGPRAVRALARLAVDVHDQPVPPDQRPPPLSFRLPPEPEVPTWARWPDLWRRALELWFDGPPATASGLLHRDFHFGNLLWDGDTITGLIDWAETSLGPPDLDVAHLCADFAMMHTVGDAASFRDAYLRAGGRLDPDPDAARFWVVADILGFLPDPAHILAPVAPRRPDLTADRVRHGLEDLLAVTLPS
ncbi:MAG TPA: aminoglycoside phosphotransferase family protein [Microlunatus sp.]|nr:aminoglycoside phosphotransferase family protein [Microlunatus sp.]